MGNRAGAQRNHAKEREFMIGAKRYCETGKMVVAVGLEPTTSRM